MNPRYSCLAVVAAQVLLLAGILRADTRISPEQGKVAGISNILQVYNLKSNGSTPDSWEALAELRQNLTTEASPFALGQGVSEAYAFVDREQGRKFPNGQLVLIRAAPVPYPDDYKQDFSNIDLTSLTPDQREEIQAQMERAEQTYKAIRYLIYRNPEGQITSTWWHEDRVQAMLKETGITIPRPTPYYPKGPDGEYLPLTQQAVEALVRLDLTDTIPPDLLAKMQTAGTLPANFTTKGPRGNNATPGTNSSATASSTLAQITSSPWLGWTLAALTLVAAALYFRRHRAKRG